MTDDAQPGETMCKLTLAVAVTAAAYLIAGDTAALTFTFTFTP